MKEAGLNGKILNEINGSVVFRRSLMWTLNSSFGGFSVSSKFCYRIRFEETRQFM